MLPRWLSAAAIIGFSCLIGSAEEAAKEPRLARPYLGLAVGDNEKLAKLKLAPKQFPRTAKKGVLVGEIAPHSPAASSPLKLLDLIQSVNGTVVDTPDDFVTAVRGLHVGDKAEFKFCRMVVGSKAASWSSPQKAEIEISTRGDVALAAMNSVTDKISGIKTTRHVDAGKDPIKLILSEKAGDKPVIFVWAGYNGKDWIFATDITLHCGTEQHSFEQGYFKWDREVEVGGVSESTVSVAPVPMLRFMDKYLDSAEVMTMRLAGKRRDDTEFSDELKNRLRQTLDGFEMLGAWKPK